MQKFIRFFFFILVLFNNGISLADWEMVDLSYVVDGDTIWIKNAMGKREKVRILGIDAPEICQDWGLESKQAIQTFLKNKKVYIQKKARRDDYGRLLSSIRSDQIDLGAYMVANGYAWAMRYGRQSHHYTQLEKQARRKKIGLWGGTKPKKPRSFRKSHGPCKF
jgi:endonuclease YncB( thermonuclease family)